MVQISKRLVIKKEIPIDVSKDLVNSLDLALAEHYCNNKDFTKGLQVYRDILPELYEHEKNAAMHKYINYSLQYAHILTLEKKWVEAIEIYRDLMKYSGFPVNVYKSLCVKSVNRLIYQN